MSGAPYHFARSCTVADEQYFRATELATRLLALTGGRTPTFHPVMLHRARSPRGPALMVRCGGRPFGYILRASCEDLGERLDKAITVALNRQALGLDVAA